MNELEAEDLEIQAGARRLARQALLEGFEILENGRPGDKIALIKQLVTPMMRQLGADDGSGQQVDQLRQNFTRLMEDIRAKQPLFATPEAVERGIEEFRDDPPRPELGAVGVLGGFGKARGRGTADPDHRPEGETARD